MTSRFKSWIREVLCKNVSLIDPGQSVKEQSILFMEAQDRMKKMPFIKNGITRSQRLGFKPISSQFKTRNEELLCLNVSLIDAGLSVEEQTILFMEAQDRPSVEEQTILFMEAQDRPSVEEQTILIMKAQDRPSVEEQTILFMEAQDRPSVEERAILFMEPQDRVKKKPIFKMRNSSSETPFQAHDQSI
ncbi:hypothetical protein Tco_1205035 [Tanacetum coccineum]